MKQSIKYIWPTGELLELSPLWKIYNRKDIKNYVIDVDPKILLHMRVEELLSESYRGGFGIKLIKDIEKNGMDRPIMLMGLDYIEVVEKLKIQFDKLRIPNSNNFIRDTLWLAKGITCKEEDEKKRWREGKYKYIVLDGRHRIGAALYLKLRSVPGLVLKVYPELV